MDYEALAGELLSIRGNLLQVPANQKLSKMLRGELFVLNYLDHREGKVHPKELSEKMAVSTARIARLLNHMEEKSLVIRQPDPGDSRQIIVQLTPLKGPEGKSSRILQRCWRALARRTPERISGFRKKSIRTTRNKEAAACAAAFFLMKS